MTLPQVSSSDPPTESGPESHLARMGLRVPATPPGEHPTTDPPGLSCLCQTPFGPLRQVSSCGTCVAWPKRSTVQAWRNSGPALTAEGSHTPHMPYPSPLALAHAHVTTPGLPQYLFPGFPQPARTCSLGTALHAVFSGSEVLWNQPPNYSEAVSSNVDRAVDLDSPLPCPLAPPDSHAFQIPRVRTLLKSPPYPFPFFPINSGLCQPQPGQVLIA